MRLIEGSIRSTGNKIKENSKIRLPIPEARSHEFVTSVGRGSAMEASDPALSSGPFVRCDLLGQASKVSGPLFLLSHGVATISTSELGRLTETRLKKPSYGTWVLIFQKYQPSKGGGHET